MSPCAWLLLHQDSLFSDVLKGFKRPVGDGPETQLQELRTLCERWGSRQRRSLVLHHAPESNVLYTAHLRPWLKGQPWPRSPGVSQYL